MAIPTQIGNYRIVSKLGSSRSGVVYRAQEVTTARQVALRVLPVDLTADEAATRQFKRDLAAIYQLEHPHLLPIHAIENHEGSPVLVMRYLTGGTLRERMNKKTFDQAMLWSMMRHVAQALDYAHAQCDDARLLVHQALKPTNILFDDSGNAYIADFGIARLVRDATQRDTSILTNSAAYTSPEQFKDEPLDGRTDQYSLAIILFELLSHRLPFNGDLRYLHVYEGPPLLHALNPDLPPELSTVLDRALAKKPAERYPSVEAFITAAETAASAPVRKQVVTPPLHSLGNSAGKGPTKSDPSSDRQPSTQLPSGEKEWYSRTPVQSGVVPGAGGDVPHNTGRRPVVIGLAFLALLTIVAFFLLWRPQSSSATLPTDPTTNPPTEIAAQTTTTPTTVPAIAASSVPAAVRVLHLLENGVATDTSWDLTEGGLPTSIRSGAEIMQLHFDDGSELFLAPDTTVEVANIVTTGVSTIHLVLESGRLLLNWPTAALLSQPGEESLLQAGWGVEVTNRPGARARVGQGMMGVSSSLDPLRFEVDCLAGECEVYGDLGGGLLLARGQYSAVGGSGVPANPRPARYELYTALADFVPTPTATATDTPVPTATSIPTSTPTRAPMVTPMETITMTVSVPTLEQPTVPTLEQPTVPASGPTEEPPTNTPQPPAPTATVEEPYRPPTAPPTQPPTNTPMLPTSMPEPTPYPGF